jgi:hypothetical protein
MKPWMFLVLVLILLVATNPSFDTHYAMVVEKSGLAGIIATGFVGFSRANCLLFSAGACRGETLTIGILGQVFWVGGD